ncbi:protein of unknown function [Shewanella benthica]|uniref:Uncharacterized protein n=1 Tax=Shewanella benthica TaxID=43661 RepID=A0A330M819_9GAMM|nr:protein of unknown function [Shewanella benthica]
MMLYGYRLYLWVFMADMESGNTFVSLVTHATLRGKLMDDPQPINTCFG